MNMEPYRVERLAGNAGAFFVLEFLVNGEVEAGGRIEESALVKPARLQTLCNCAFRQGVLAERKRVKQIIEVNKATFPDGRSVAALDLVLHMLEKGD